MGNWKALYVDGALPWYKYVNTIWPIEAERCELFRMALCQLSEGAVKFVGSFGHRARTTV